MKKHREIIYAALMFFFITAIFSSCECRSLFGGSGGSDKGRKMLAVFGVLYGWSDQASLDLFEGQANTDLFYPVSGDPVVGATVIFGDSTIHSEVQGQDYLNGTYYAPLSFNAGDLVYVKLKRERGVPYFSQSCMAPDSYCTIISPASGAVISAPFDIAWTVNPGSYPASAVLVEIARGNDVSIVYRKALPIQETSVAIPKSMTMSEGVFTIKIIPYIQLNFPSENIHMYSRVLVYSVHDPGKVEVRLSSPE